MVKILVIGDLHGRMPRIHFKDFDYIICVGDVCDDRGFRPYINKWFSFLKNNEHISFDKFLGKEFSPRKEEVLLKESISRGRRILEYLNSFGKPVFFVPGNWDDSYGPTKIKNPDKNDYSYSRAFLDYWLGRYSNEGLIGGLENVYDLQYRLYSDEFVNILGYGLISGPEDFKGRFSKSNLTKKQKTFLLNLAKKIPLRLSKLWLKRNRKAVSIFVTHNVPYGVLDKIKDKKSPGHGKHAGSTVARDFCLKKKPEICVGGHVHEHYGKKKLGSTTVINAGYGKDAQVLLDIKGKKVRVKFVESLKEKYGKKS